MNRNSPILMIGLDAAEVSLVEQLSLEGKLPTLRSLMEKGCFGVLESVATKFAGGVWPTFYTSKAVPWHGIYHNKLWRPDRMRCEVVSDSWLPAQPFWERLDAEKYRVCVVDVPMTVTPPRQINGVHLAGWGTHDLIVKGSWPPDLWIRLKKDFGAPTMPPEYFGPQTSKTLLQLRDDLLRSTEQMVRISKSLLAEQIWDLFVVVFGATHRAGHYLWDLSQIDPEDLTRSRRETLERALVDVYQSCDYAVSRLIEKAPPNAKIIVFAVHGMCQNPGWSDLCPEILTRIQLGKESAPAKMGLLYKVKRRIPFQLIRQVVTRLPRGIQNRLVAVWSASMFDWNTTRYFPVPMDHAGYVRVNLKGREPQGIVTPGAEYDALCDELEVAFLGLRDIDTSEPIVDQVFKARDLGPLDAPYSALLPDIVVTWSNVSAIRSQGIFSETLGEIRVKGLGKLPSGRAGNHSDQGWFVAVGNGIKPGSRAESHPVTDLVPTIFHWLDAKPEDAFQGRLIPALAKGTVLSS